MNDHPVPILLNGKKSYTKYRKHFFVFLTFFIVCIFECFLADILDMDLISPRFAMKLPQRQFPVS